MRTTALLLAVSVSFAFPGGRGAQQEEPACEDAYTFVADSVDFKAARIKGASGQRAHFFGDEGACPNGRNCQKNSYVIPGDEVIVSSSAGKFACAWYQPKKGRETVGWILADRIEFIAVNTTPRLTEWLGEWSYRNNAFTVARSGQPGELRVIGSAMWQGAGDNIHVGDIDATGTPKGNVVKVEDYPDNEGCKAMLWLIGSRMVAKDNLNCGGMNVTFAGVYSKAGG